ncbi:cupin domain-containing protein [Actinobacillus capsulatus]|uniref:cupin domain-containing protein n=1 Tax=Actinobacillus capsulatus TaxID=717 RepID=UPI0003802B57|nr:cupin domain-containing protein [Actinobacillus capsulatus]
MKKSLFLTALAATVMSQTALAEDNHQTITHRAELKFIQAPTEHFTGKAQFAYLPKMPNSQDAQAVVEFQPNTITDWHTHSQGQYLIVTEGEGRTQEWGGEIRVLKKGDVVWCPPNVKHWHGAAEHSAMTHIAIAPNAAENKPTWLERVELPKATAPDLKADLQKIQQIEPLTDKQLAIVPIALFSVKGNLDSLTPALENGLKAGLTVAEINEIFAHQYAYAGFPRALNGLQTFQKLLKARQEKGIQDETGTKPTALAPQDFYSRGSQMLSTLTQREAPALLQNFEGVDYTLKSHLFGYLFARDNFSPVNREIVTVSTISGLETVPNQLRSHLTILHNLGLNETELNRVIAELAKQDKIVAEKADTVLKTVLKK